MFKRTKAINKLLKLRKRIKVIPGSTSAGKTFGILPILIDKAIKTSNLEISVISESIPHLKRGAMKDFLKIMKWTKRFNRSQWHITDRIYTYSNGSTIEFFSADDETKLLGARRDILFINEANNIHWEAYYNAAVRTRLEVWLDFNPSNEFWAHEELLDDPDAEWLTLTYLDNEVLDKAIIREIEKARFKGYHDIKAKDLFVTANIKNNYWANWWKVYGMGQLGVLEGVIFTNWSIIDSVPPEAEYLGSGLDFGYSNHPTSLMDAYKYNGEIIWDEAIYRTGLQNPTIAHIMRSQGKKDYDYITADSAEPKSIDEINAYGFSIEGVDKGADSINFGISIMQEESFRVTKRSINTIKELRMYAWVEDKTGKKLNKPIDAYNHSMDAMRYFYMMKLSNRKYVDPAYEDEAFQKALELFS